MTRMDSVRNAADMTKDSVRHAAEVAAPYAGTAKDGAVHYSRQASAKAKQTYDARLAARVEQAREQALAAVPPKAVNAVETAAKRTRKSAKAAAEFTAPKIGTAVAVTRATTGPAKDEVVLRGSAALHALRGQVSAADIDRLVRRRVRRQQTGRVFRGMVIAGLAGGAAFAAFKWWSKQSNPDWLVEPSEPTEEFESKDRVAMNGSGTLTIVDPVEEGLAEESGSSLNGSTSSIDRVDGSAGALDPEVEAKQAEAERPEDDR